MCLSSKLTFDNEGFLSVANPYLVFYSRVDILQEDVYKQGERCSNCPKTSECKTNLCSGSNASLCFRYITYSPVFILSQWCTVSYCDAVRVRSLIGMPFWHLYIYICISYKVIEVMCCFYFGCQGHCYLCT